MSEERLEELDDEEQEALLLREIAGARLLWDGLREIENLRRLWTAKK